MTFINKMLRYAMLSALFSVLPGTVLSTKQSFVKYEKLVETQILSGYSTSYRPTRSNKEPLIVNFDLKLKKLVALDIREQVLVVNMFVMMRWNDPQLCWNKTEFNNTDYITVDSSSLWVPDIVLYNTAEKDSKAHTDFYKTKATIRNDGQVIWVAPVTFQASCNVNVKWFPFDVQKCDLKFGSWSYAKSKLKIVFWNKPTSVNAFRSEKMHYSSGHWNMNSFTASVEEEKYSCCDEKFSQITYGVTLSRIPTYYLLYLVLPCILLVLLSLTAFFVPPETGERIGFGITNVLAMSVYLLVISDKLPEKSDHSPLIGLFYVILFFIMVFELMACIITTHMAFKTTPPPDWMIDRFLKKKKTKSKPKGLRKSPPQISTQVQGIDHSIPGSIEIDNNAIRGVNLRKRFTLSAFNDEIVMKYQLMWGEIALNIDKKLFYGFIFLTFISPILVIIAWEATE